MANSETQFLELLSNLTVRMNHALESTNSPPPIGLILLPSNQIEAVMYVPEDEEEDLSVTVNELQQSLISLTKSKDAVAACIAYPQFSEGAIVVLMENSENFCAQYKIPVVTEPSLSLDLTNIVIGDGYNFAFGD